MFGSGSSSGVGGASQSSHSGHSFGPSSSSDSGISRSSSFSNSISQARSSHRSSTPSHRGAERASMDSYNSYRSSNDSSGYRNTSNTSGDSFSARNGYSTSTPSNREAERASLACYDNSYRGSSSSSNFKSERVSSDSHSSRSSYNSTSHRQAERTDMEAYANHRVSSSHENAGGAHADQPSDRPSGAPVATGLDHSDAYAEYARSRLQAGQPVGPRQPASFAPSYRQAESESLNALDTHQTDERARATRAQELATHRQAEIESMQALAEYGGKQTAADPESVAYQAIETLGGLPSTTGLGFVALGNTYDHVRAWNIRTEAASIITRGNAGNFASNMAKAEALIGKKPASNPANWASHRQAHLKYGTIGSLKNAVKAGDLPASPNAASSKAIAAAVEDHKLANNLGRAARIGGWVLGPTIGAAEGYMSIEEGDPIGMQYAKTITGGLKQVDNTVVAAGAGSITATFTAPSAPLTFGGGPVAAGIAGGIMLERKYNSTDTNREIDNYIDSWTATIAKGIGKSIELGHRAIDRSKQAMHQISNVVASIFK